MKYLLAAMLVGTTIVGVNLTTTTAADAQSRRTLEQNERNDRQDLDRDIQRERYEERTGRGQRYQEYKAREHDDCDRLREDARRLGHRVDPRCR
jgi:Ni/Co efflux regulator RcnB